MVSRDHVSVRLSASGLAKVQEIQTSTGANRSQVIRSLLHAALSSELIIKSVEAKLVDL